METPDLNDMPADWERGDMGLMTCAHDLVWTRRIPGRNKTVLRVQFEPLQGGYVFGVVGIDAGAVKTQHIVKPASYRFYPGSPAFATPQAAAVWAEIEGLT